MLRCNHLDVVGLSYLTHMKRSFGFAVWSVSMLVVVTIHAIFPWFFTETFSNSVLRLANRLEHEEKETQ